METEGPSKTMSTEISQCIFFFSSHLVLTPTSRGYTCALIVHLRAVDPRRTAGMAEREEDACQHFEELKDILSRLSPHCWKKDFKLHINIFIAERLIQRDVVIAIPGVNEEYELDHIVLHGLRHLVAGAIQEWELVQQPKHAASCAKLEGALVWQGRGYVDSILLFSHFNHSYRVNLRTFRQLYGW